MNEQEKWDYINQLDDELLLGGVILSEWSTFIARDAEIAFCNGANLSSIITAVAVIESHLRFEYSYSLGEGKRSLFHIIEQAPISNELKRDIHLLRRYRNKWVHVNNPEDDQHLLEKPELIEEEQEETAKLAIKTMLQTLYLEQCV